MYVYTDKIRLQDELEVPNPFSGIAATQELLSLRKEVRRQDRQLIIEEIWVARRNC